MKLNRLTLLSLLLLLSPALFAQADFSLHLKNGFVTLQPNIRKGIVDSFNLKAQRFQQKSFAILQFESIPTEATKKLLSANGIELLEYIPNNAYTVTISGNPSSTILVYSCAFTGDENGIEAGFRYHPSFRHKSCRHP
jgi:hypothetical protein